MSASASNSIADEIAKLHKLKTDGAITEDEFQQQKQALFGQPASGKTTSPKPADSVIPGDTNSILLRNRWWFQVVVLWLVIPAGIVLMLSYPAYQKKGQMVRIGRGTKATLIVLASLLWALLSARLIADPNFRQGYSEGRTESTVASTETQTPTAEPEPGGLLPKCDSTELQAKIRQVVGDKLATMGLPAGSLGDMYGQLKETHSEQAEAIKRSVVGKNGITADNVEVCSVATDSGEMLMTVVLARNGEVGGAVSNFGVPGAVAEWGAQE